MRLGRVSAFIMVAGLAGCESSNAQIAELLSRSNEVTSLTFTTSYEIPQNSQYVPPVNLTVDDATRARDAYRATLSLPQFPPGMFHCPSSYGAYYHATFMQASQVVLNVDYNTGGCRDVTLLPSKIVLQALSPDFWNEMAHDLDVGGLR
jgi:hypothetical protein